MIKHSYNDLKNQLKCFDIEERKKKFTPSNIEYYESEILEYCEFVQENYPEKLADIVKSLENNKVPKFPMSMENTIERDYETCRLLSFLEEPFIAIYQ